MQFQIKKDTPMEKLGYGSIPLDLRGKITGETPAKAVRTGGDMTNAEYAKENGISTRQASKRRRGY